MTSASAEKTSSHQDMPYSVLQGNCGWLLYDNRSLHHHPISLSHLSFLHFFFPAMQRTLNSRNLICIQPTGGYTSLQLPSLVLLSLSSYFSLYTPVCHIHANVYTSSRHVFYHICKVLPTQFKFVQFTSFPAYVLPTLNCFVFHSFISTHFYLLWILCNLIASTAVLPVYNI
jgi:hypothetical protein